MTHHCNKHVDEYDDDGDMIESKQKHSYTFHNGRRMATAWKTVSIQIVFLLRREFDLNAVDTDETKHGPEQTVERPR